MRSAARHPVQLVVGVHNRRQPGFADRHFKRQQVHLTQLALAHVHRRPIETGFRHAMRSKVFAGGCHALGQVRPLQPTDVCLAHAGHQIGILSKGLFQASPAWVAGDIQYWRQPVVHAGSPHLRARHAGLRLSQFRLPGARQADALRKHIRAAGHEAAAAFVVNHGRDAQAGLSHKKVLGLRVGLRHLRRSHRIASGRAHHLADAVVQHRLGLFRHKVGLVEHVVQPDGAQLSDLLFRCHAGQQVRHTLGDG